MKFLLQICWMVTVLFVTNAAFADIDPEKMPEDFRKNFPVSVSDSVKVQSKLGKLPPSNAKRIEEATNAGAKFMQHYLDGYLCDGAPEWEFILDNLVDTEGIRDGCKNIKLPERTVSGRTYLVVREMCPQIVLSDFTTENGEVSLKYEMTTLGTLSYTSSNNNTFTPERSGEKMQIVVVINPKNKVYKFIPEDWNRQVIYLNTLSDLEGYYVFHGITPPADTSPTPDDIRNVKVAKQLRQQATQVCR